MITSIAMGVAGEVGASDMGRWLPQATKRKKQFTDPLIFLERGSKIRTLKLDRAFPAK